VVMKPLRRQVMAALAVGGVLAGLFVGQVGAFHSLKRQPGSRRFIPSRLPKPPFYHPIGTPKFYAGNP